jgi:hypothetical protein
VGLVGSLVALPVVLLMAAADAGAPDAGAPAPSLLAPFKNPVQTPPRDQYELHRAKDGSRDLLYEATAFTARVARDGSVKFHDKGLAVALLPLLFLPRGYRPPAPDVPSLQSFARDSFLHLTPKHIPPELRDESTTYYGSRLPIPTTTPFRPDPREACLYPRSCFFEADVTIINVTGTFDVTDEVMRFSGQDPYRFAKAQFLAATREMRAKLAARAHADDVRDAAAALPDRLQRIRCDDRMSVADRLAILRGLRAELDTTAPEARIAVAQIDVALAAFETSARPDGAPACPRP